MGIYKKGKKNKSNIGDIVQMTPERVLWQIEHLCEMLLIGGVGEFFPNQYPTIAAYLNAHLTQKMLVGKVTGYGAEAYGPTKEDLNRWERIEDEQCVGVKFKSKYGALTGYFHERDLVKVKRKKKK